MFRFLRLRAQVSISADSSDGKKAAGRKSLIRPAVAVRFEDYVQHYAYAINRLWSFSGKIGPGFNHFDNLTCILPRIIYYQIY
jgi:hypothetical protein